MRAADGKPEDLLARKEDEVRRRVSALRRIRQKPVRVLDAPQERRQGLFDAAAAEIAEQQYELLCRRLVDQNEAVLAAQERLRDGAYGICEACGHPIPQRRLLAMPTATLCVQCQQRRETAMAA